MNKDLSDQSEEPVAETPEDVAILYSWANLHGAKYRDFSASRREYRAQVRHRAAEDLRQQELAAHAEAEAAAAEAEQKARDAEREARTSERHESPVTRDRALREADEAARRASAERVEAARRAEAAAMAEAAALREEREIAEAQASAQRQAARWTDSEIRRRDLAGPQPVRLPAQGGDPYEATPGAPAFQNVSKPIESLEYTESQRYRGEALRGEANRMDLPLVDVRADDRRVFRQPEPEHRRPRGFRPDQPSGMRSPYRAAPSDSTVRSRINSESDFPRVTPAGPAPVYPTSPQEFPSHGGPRPASPVLAPANDRVWPGQEHSTPAWLYGGTPAASSDVPRQVVPAAVLSGADTLQSSRERVASRWFALKGVFEGTSEAVAEPPRQKEVRTPALAVFSLAGGVGKTSLVATLGRTLSSLGEKVLLADTTSHGLLPYYFGASELKTGVVRTFSPPSGSSDAPIHLVSYDVDARADRAAEQALVDEITKSAAGVQRLLLDLNSTSGWLMRRLTRLAVTVLVPVAPDMNSVISLQGLERYFEGAVAADGLPLKPFYVLNQFDASLPLHLDVREVLRRQLGERLLPYVVRRSPAVSEALAEGMTVADYQPEGSISEDYLNIAKWLRGIVSPVSAGLRTTRWSER